MLDLQLRRTHCNDDKGHTMTTKDTPLIIERVANGYQAALEAAVATERAESARLRHLLNLARDDYNTAAQRLQDIGDYAHDHSTGPAVPDALWEVRSMAYGSGA